MYIQPRQLMKETPRYNLFDESITGVVLDSAPFGYIALHVQTWVSIAHTPQAAITIDSEIFKATLSAALLSRQPVLSAIYERSMSTEPDEEEETVEEQTTTTTQTGARRSSHTNGAASTTTRAKTTMTSMSLTETEPAQTTETTSPETVSTDAQDAATDTVTRSPATVRRRKKLTAYAKMRRAFDGEKLVQNVLRDALLSAIYSATVY